MQIERWLKSSFIHADSVSIHFKPSALFPFCSGALLISWLESLLFLIFSFFYLFLPTLSFLPLETSFPPLLLTSIYPDLCLLSVRTSKSSPALPNKRLTSSDLSTVTCNWWHTIKPAPLWICYTISFLFFHRRVLHWAGKPYCSNPPPHLRGGWWWYDDESQ